MVPIKLKLFALVTLEVRVFGARFKKTLFKKSIWEYEAAKISKRLIDISTKEEDESPPQFIDVVAKVIPHLLQFRSC